MQADSANEKEAFGAPGIEPRSPHRNKNGIGMAYAASSRIWFTLFGGIVTEVYYPTVDRPQLRLWAHLRARVRYRPQLGKAGICWGPAMPLRCKTAYLPFWSNENYQSPGLRSRITSAPAGVRSKARAFGDGYSSAPRTMFDG